MIVKQVSIDVKVNDSNIDLEGIIKNLLIEKGFNVLGSDQIDLSETYSKQCNKSFIVR